MQYAPPFPATAARVSLLVGALALALSVGPMVVLLSPPLVLVALVALLLTGGVFLHPPIAAYLLLGATPLIVGIQRGSILPVLRPHEALALILAGALLFRHLLLFKTGQSIRIRPTRLDVSILLLAFTSSVLPLLGMGLRGEAISQDDLFFSLILWKYYALFLIIRSSIRAEQQVRNCLWISMGSAGIVAVIAIIQAMGLFGVPEFLTTYYGEVSAVAGTNAGATLTNPQAAADVFVFNIVIAAGLLLYTSTKRALLVGLMVLMVFGTVATGKVSGALALLVGLGAFGLITHRFGRALALFPVAVIAGIALEPVIRGRLTHIDPSTGIPLSWIGRWRNLQTHFWPQLFSDSRWVLGVRPAARVEIPQYLGMGRYAWIESGHTWLLWTGGIPFVIAFVVFLWVSLRIVAPIARERRDAIGVAAIASFAALLIMAVLMTFDAHLILRGSADLNFALLALATTGYAGVFARRPERSAPR